MEADEIKRLTELLNERTMKLMERESELADRFEELEAQKEELTAAVEELITKNTELVERNQELDQILYRSSHDLKSPLSSMFGILRLLKNEKLPDHLHDYCFHMEQKLEQMNGVIQTLTLLGQSVLDEIKNKVIDLRKIVEDEFSSLQYLPHYRFISFRTKFSGTEEVFTDELLIRILIKSLLSNAIIFREAKPGSIEVFAETDASGLRIEVKDDGEGIPDEIAPKIWDMFYRGSERSVGQGMGLYMAKKIAQRLRGSIQFYSREGATVFEVSIPLSPAPAA